MLLRSTPAEPVEVFMLRRSARSSFAPGVYAFPGGAVDESDYAPDALACIDGADAGRLASMFRAQPAAGLADPQIAEPSHADRAALISAALRELFEESGVLLGTQAAVDPGALHSARTQLFEQTISMTQALRTLGVRLDAGELELFSQWITPPREGRRFDAYFFVGRGDGHHAIADRIETHDEVWIAPKRALARCEAGTYAMVYPTIKHVERLAAFSSVDELFDFAKAKPILRIMPEMTGAQGFTLPRELEHAW